MAELVLVRHALPEIRPDVPAERWRLGEEGRAAARALASVLPVGARVLTSAEPKARATADALAGRLARGLPATSAATTTRGAAVTADARLREAGRPHVRDGYRALARAYVAGRRHPGWEAHAAVAARVASAIADHRGNAPLVVVGHGLALTLWLEHTGAVADPAAFWAAMTFPDAWALYGGALRRIAR